MPGTATPFARTALATAIFATATTLAATTLAQPAPLMLEEIVVTARYNF